MSNVSTNLNNIPISTSEINVTNESEESARATINEYTNKRDTEKKNMMNKLSKQQMVNIIFKQNDLLAQQSSQMLEIIDMANNIEQSTRSDEATKCDVKIEKCSQYASIQNRQIKMYENSVRIQIVLFILFIILIVWLVYYYISGNQLPE